MTKQHTVDVISEAAKAAPPVTVTLAALSGHLNVFIAIATLIYVALQAGYLIWKWRKEFKEARALKKAQALMVGSKP